MIKCEVIPTEAICDQRGWVTEPINSEDLLNGYVKNIHIVSLEPGTIRGNHYHLIRTEFTLIMGNNCQFMAIDNDMGTEKCLITDGSKPVLVRIPPKTSHAFKNIGNFTIYLLCYSGQKFDPAEPDVFENKILE